MNIYDNGSISVSALNGYIKGMMERDDFLSCVAVSGEISNFKRNISGHLYFSLKDDGAAVSAVMFKSSASRLTFIPSDGMKVTVWGQVSLYEKTGQYQIYIQTMMPNGEGELARAYEALKRKLEAEGLFAQERKRALPRLPRRIGIITSATGAAVRDMINVTGRRYPLADIILFPSAVQGAEAPAQLITGVGYFNAMQNVDVIIIGRGGGSIEDLWAFNDEGLVRAVAGSDIPIISAVGHETDFTLCDFAADCRAPTPSAAAELAVPDVKAIGEYLSRCELKLGRAVQTKVTRGVEDVFALERIISLNSPLAKLERSRLLVENIAGRIDSAAKEKTRRSGAVLGELSARLEGLNPLAVLSRGYGAIEDGDGNIISSVAGMKVGGEISVVMSDGRARARVTDVEQKLNERNSEI